RAELFFSGVFGSAARAEVRPLLPCILAGNAIAAANDELRVMPRLVDELLADTSDLSAQALATAAPAYLADQGLFSDPQASFEALGVARRYLDRLLDDLRARGC